MKKVKIDEIRELIHLMEQSALEELELEQDGVRLSLKKSLAQGSKKPHGETVRPSVNEPIHNAAEATAEPKSAADQSSDDDEGALHKIVSPMVGTFYQAPAPDADPYVQVGDRVNEKTVVCIVEAMKLMNEIEAEVTGEVVKVLVENGQLVEYGQPLFLVKTQ